MAESITPLVSVGIPFYNAELFLKEAIMSVIMQSHKNIEIILMDDGSLDNSLQIANNFAAKFDNIRVFSDGLNKGLAKRLNELIEVSNGVFYARMDADDMMHPERLKIQVEFLINNPEVDLCGSGLISLENNATIIGIRKGGYRDNFTLPEMFKGTWCVHPTITGRLKWFQNNSYNHNMKRSEDFDLWIRTVEHSKFVRLEQPLLFYREASTSTLKKYYKDTKFCIKIYWQNKIRIGSISTFKLTVLKISKLLLYGTFSLIGISRFLLQRRSLRLDVEEQFYYQSKIDEIVTNTLDNA